jgi:protein-L-isoaspartate(D-aspartate) O-methyltransferase
VSSDAETLVAQLRNVIRSGRVLEAIRAVPRERFVPADQHDHAYENIALPIACEQTISQPLVVARMLELLELGPDDRVLDVGTGSGYHAALLASLAAHVWTIERHAELSREAAATARELGIENITFVVGDGWQGVPSAAPFDAINVAATPGESVPEPLLAQLAPGGRLVAPVGGTSQHLTLTRRSGDEFRRRRLEPVRFVPLVRED